MADTTTVVEGKIKFREGKKWKPRWCVLKKPSPVADRLQVILYKDLTEYTKNEAKPKSTFALDAFYGLDAGFAFDRESHVLAIICHKNISLLAFEMRENMIQFEIKIRQSMGEEHQFPVKVVKAPSSSRLPKDPVRLMIHDMRFCLIAQVPPKILLSWNVEDLRRFGAREGKFCFEGGTRCGKGSGVFALQSEQAEDIADIVNLASTGKLANCHRKFKNRRRHSQSASQEVVSEISYTTLIISLDHSELDGFDGATSSDVASIADFLCQSSTNCNSFSDITNPAKSVLRPRSGQEYVVVQRKHISSPGLSDLLPQLTNSIFSFDDVKTNEALCHSHHHNTLPDLSSCNSHLQCLQLRVPSSSPQESPSISSTAETVRSFSSAHIQSWEPGISHPHHGRGEQSSVTDTSSLVFSQPVLSDRLVTSASPALWKSARAGENQSIFFPMDTSFTASPPSSPLGQYMQAHTPTYVNQEFVDKHYSASSSSQTVNTVSSHSSASPIRAGVHSLTSSIYKDSSRHNSLAETSIHGSSFRLSRTRSRHSESDANKGDKHCLSLPSAKEPQSLVSSSVHRSHSDSKRQEAGEKELLSVAPEIPSHVTCQMHKNRYDKFADSSIISRRRRQCGQAIHENAEATVVDNSTDLKETSLHLPLPKPSGYKNIDCINAASYAASSTPSPRSLSSGTDSVHVSRTSHLENILEYTYPSEMPSSSRYSFGGESSRSSNVCGVASSTPLPISSSPPPLLPRRTRLSSSPVSSCSLTSVLTSSDASDSPPSYFAPSPPSTPPPPALPPRIPLMPSTIPASTQVEAEIESDSAEEEQELNYIEVDMSPAEKVVATPQPAYSRRSKRVRQQREKDYAKLRYAVIDHRATKALQQTRQEHEQLKDSRKENQPKETNFGRTGVHLSRINSAPASSKRKQISLVPRERKLSSGSIESC